MQFATEKPELQAYPTICPTANTAPEWCIMIHNTTTEDFMIPAFIDIAEAMSFTPDIESCLLTLNTLPFIN
jgi:hypothetical protein